jgi:hypothetical protein
MAIPGKTRGQDATPSAGTTRNTLHTATVVLLVLLCAASCALMLMLDPMSIAVDSVYQGF